MTRRFRVHHSTVAAYLALVLSLGGVSYAAVVVTSRDISDNTIQSVDVHDKGLQLKDLSPQAIKALSSQGTRVNVAANPNTAVDPCLDTTVPGKTMIYCGTSTRHWEAGGFGVPGIQVWKDSLGNVHIRGSATMADGVGGTLFRLPKSMRPDRLLSFQVATGFSAGSGGGSTALLVIYPSATSAGAVGLFQIANPADNVVHLGEIVFRAAG